jgi:hypothetical protein
MGKIYSPPIEIGKFEFDYSNFNMEAFTKAETEYVEKVKHYARTSGSGDFRGEEIRFPVADGYARYIVFSTKPVVLLHLSIGDGWMYEYAHRLTAKDIAEEVRRRKETNKLFSEAG